MSAGLIDHVVKSVRFSDLPTFVLLVVLFQMWYRTNKNPSNLPPGPIKMPVLGHLPFLGSQPHKRLVQWKSKYGPIMQVWFGSYRAVVIQDVDLIRKSLNLKTFSGRPDLNFLLARSNGKQSAGLVVADGWHWLEQRRFSIRYLRDNGFGTNKMETFSQLEADKLLLRLKATNQKPTQVLNMFNIAVVNPLWTIMFSEPLDQNDIEAKEASHRMNRFSNVLFRGMFPLAIYFYKFYYSTTRAFEKTGNLASLPIFIPWLAKYASKLSGYSTMVEDIFLAKSFAKKQLDQHAKNYIQDQPRDFIDVYRDAVMSAQGPESSFYEKEQLEYIVFDFFAASGETIATVLSWLCAFLVHHPEVQQKLRAEIDQIIGRDAVPSLAHRLQMPYTQGLINETMRFASINPFSVVHNTTEDVEFGGFFIPKDTMIVPNVYGVHFDEALWGDPENFRPERFLDEDGKFKMSPNFLAFSTGKRICLGEGLARDELFLFITRIFQNFTVHAATKLPNLEPHCGFTHSPHPFEVIWKQREDYSSKNYSI